MDHDPDPDRWARLRFAIIGPLLAAPPGPGELRKALRDLSARVARKARDPVAVLRRRGRNDAGRTRRMTAALMQALQIQYQAHPGVVSQFISPSISQEVLQWMGWPFPR